MTDVFFHPRVHRGLFRGLNRTILGLEIRRVLRNARTLILIVVMPTSFFLLYGLRYSGTGNGPGNGPGIGAAQPLAQIMVNVAAYGAMVAATSSGASIAVERGAGWNRQLRLTPLSPSAQVAVKTTAAMVLGLVAVLAQFALGAALGVGLPTHTWLLAGVAAWLGSMLFAAFGLLCGLLLPWENVMQLVGPGLALLAVFGGLFIPVSLLPRAMQTAAPFIPSYGPGSIARDCLTGLPTTGALLNLVAWTCLFACAATWRLRRDVGRL
jgi:ABC-2 type transport system permease protein